MINLKWLRLEVIKAKLEVVLTKFKCLLTF